MHSILVNWSVEPTHVRLFVIYVVAVGCFVAVRSIQLARRLYRPPGAESLTVEAFLDSGATTDRIATAALSGGIRCKSNVQRRDTQQNECQIATTEESTQRFQEVESEFLTRLEVCEADLASMRRLVPLTIGLSIFVVVYGAFPTWTDEFNNSRLTGNVAACMASERLFARFAIGLGVSIFIYTAYSFFTGTLSRRRIHWKQLCGTSQRTFRRI